MSNTITNNEAAPAMTAAQYVATQPDLATAWDNCERADWLIAFARNMRIANKAQFVRVAIGETEAVLQIWRKAHPDAAVAEKAIAAAKAWLASPAASASDAASAAAYAASAAAYADAASAYADADADADAASDAAFAADAAYTYASAAFKKAQCDRIRAIITNPF